MKHLLTLVLVSLSVIMQAQAESTATNLKIFGFSEKDSQIPLDRVEQQVTLVESVRGNSDLRISFVVVDNGGSTDVSPEATLYLTSFNQSEMRDAGAVHKIAQITKLISTQRIEAGVYEAKVIMLDLENTCGEGSYQVVKKIRIDAKTMSMKIRAFDNTEEFGYGRITEPVYVSQTCAGPVN